MLTPLSSSPSGVCSTEQNIEAQIVLAGDPRQLGPVIKDRRANALGYGISYIDRLMNCELYKVDVNSGKYNQKYIVQLVKNYRSHNAILRVPNELFYGGKLVAKANKGKYAKSQNIDQTEISLSRTISPALSSFDYYYYRNNGLFHRP